MNSGLIYNIYTIREVREWLINNKSNGLSEYCIVLTRAYALVNNPCAKDDDPAIVVTYDADRPIGYSAVFADEYIEGNTLGRLYWGTTEWIEPEYRGKGIAGKMMRTLKEAVGENKYIGLDSSIASVKLDQKQGASIVYYDRTRFVLNAHDSFKGRIMSKYVHCSNSKVLKRLANVDYQNRYVNYIDESTYKFVKAHAGNDVFVRQREMFNWILCFPFMQNTESDPKAMNDICEFGSTVGSYSINAIKVYVKNELSGFYIVSQTDNVRTLRYLYFDEKYRDEVFSSVTLNMIKPGIDRVLFMSAELQSFMHQRGIKHLNRKSYIDQIALTLPPGMSVDKNLHIQGGDGDMFC